LAFCHNDVLAIVARKTLNPFFSVPAVEPLMICAGRDPLGAE
jgi:hypothetical protein